MTVKDEVVSWLEAKMDCDSLEETKNFIRSHLTGIEEVAEETVRREGYSYPVQAALEWTDFPEKSYGDVTFPAGSYEALRIQIGEAKGTTGGVCSTRIFVLSTVSGSRTRKREKAAQACSDRR